MDSGRRRLHIDHGGFAIVTWLAKPLARLVSRFEEPQSDCILGLTVIIFDCTRAIIVHALNMRRVPLIASFPKSVVLSEDLLADGESAWRHHHERRRDHPLKH